MLPVGEWGTKKVVSEAERRCRSFPLRKGCIRVFVDRLSIFQCSINITSAS